MPHKITSLNTCKTYNLVLQPDMPIIVEGKSLKFFDVDAQLLEHSQDKGISDCGNFTVELI